MMDISDRVQILIRQRTERALLAVAAAFLTDLKKKVGVPAPRRRTKSGRIVAATPATPGAPPRVVTGRGRSSLSMRLEVSERRAIIRVGTHYMMIHEAKDHKWLRITWTENKQKYQELFRRVFSGSY